MRSIYMIGFTLLMGSLFSQSILPFEEDFEAGVFDTNMTPFPNREGVDGEIEIYDGIGRNDTRGLYLGKTMDGTGLTTNALDILLDLSDESDVELSFWIQSVYDNNHEEDGIFLSDDGGTNFIQVLEFIPEEWCPLRYGQYPPMDIDEIAAAAGLDLTSEFVIRFQQRGEHDFFGGPDNLGGFYLDEIKVYDPNLVYARLPFSDDFESGTFETAWAQNFADNTSESSSGDAITSPMNLVEIAEGSGLNDSYGVWIGKRCDGSFVSNALDLHLDLLNEEDVELSFWIQSVYDNNHEEDGIYFSNDGGVNFTKVVDFLPDEWCPLTFGQYPPIDVDGLAETAGLDLTSQFVIRFQQRGEHDFFGGPDNLGGFVLDDVRVYDPQLEYERLPFEDDFETGTFGTAWAQNFADNTSESSSGDAITSPMNLVEVVEGSGVNDSYGVWMGKRCDGSFVTNALDLHLNLDNETEVDLSFWLQSVYEDTHPEDGIYYSDDNGQSFVKVFSFDFSSIPPITFIEYRLDIDELLSENGLEMSPQSVIRFQQRGQDDFFGGPDNLDGYLLDDISVTNGITSVQNVLKRDDIRIYPNPVSEVLNIDTRDEKKSKIKSLVILDVLGQPLVSNSYNSNETLELSSLSAGTYFLLVSYQDGSRTSKKFIKH